MRTFAQAALAALAVLSLCGALAIGSNVYGTAWATERSGAEQRALAECRRHTMDCAVTRWVCTTR